MPAGPDGRAERASWLRIALTPGIGPVATAGLLARFGLPEDILGASHAALAALIGARRASALLQPDPDRDHAIQASLAWSEQPGCRLLTLIDRDYPERLLQTADPPPVLWAQGRVDRLARPTLAIVGSRAATRGGIADAQAFAHCLGERGLTIVSGLALGIDAAAHRGALDTPGGTVAVLGTGTDRIYPRQQAGLAARIAEQGLLLSELPPGTEPRPGAFPRRNRLIAGLSLGVLVVEAALRSGSLITARLAADIGRDVFAMPGSIHSPTARGCHELIRQGARLVESADDILAELGDRVTASVAAHPLPARTANPPDTNPPDTNRTPSADTHDPVLDALGWDPVDAQTLLERLQQDRRGARGPVTTAPELLERLVALELSGAVERLSDGRFKRLFK
jgi:DNA processing protein